MNKVSVLGIQISNLSSDELNQQILKCVASHRKSLVLNVNIHAMNMADKYPWFKQLLNSAEIVFCDGDGVRLGAKLLGVQIKEKITFNRWIWSFAEFSQTHGISWYCIGSNDKVIQASITKLETLFPSLIIKGYRNGFFTTEKDSRRTVDDINSKKPDVILLGMGMPLQENWLLANWQSTEATIALTGGAVFEYVSGTTKMTPNIFFKFKLEWFYRFVHEPRRLFKRYFIGNFWFMFRVLFTTIRGKKG